MREEKESLFQEEQFVVERRIQSKNLKPRLLALEIVGWLSFCQY